MGNISNLENLIKKLLTWINIYVIIKQKWDFNKGLKKSIKNKKSPWQKIKTMIYLIHSKERGWMIWGHRQDKKIVVDKK